ncbi:GNAT family N-acetyltransferase [Photobacterium sanguinicancri]|uniref:GNAT family N-acetyltransferase n=1 Tax=Photobacterium sanguinicancri TaxID=875932 RepID=UPI002480D3F2|nr:GNAT family N-acetyltransferase [Photobacterium sanguinicancri]
MTMEQAPLNYTIRSISENDITKRFKTGDRAFQPLKSFLQKQAFNFTSSMVAQTYVCTLLDDKDADTNVVIGYITLTCSEIDLQGTYTLEDCEHANQYNSLPAVKIARLAIDSRYRGGNGLGSELVEIATAIAAEEIAPIAGCRFLVTDAKPEAIDFYHKNGFTFLDTDENNNEEHPIMFLDLLAAYEEEAA